jgi:hypothetical protein
VHAVALPQVGNDGTDRFVHGSLRCLSVLYTVVMLRDNTSTARRSFPTETHRGQSVRTLPLPQR